MLLFSSCISNPTATHQFWRKSDQLRTNCVVALNTSVPLSYFSFFWSRFSSHNLKHAKLSQCKRWKIGINKSKSPNSEDYNILGVETVKYLWQKKTYTESSLEFKRQKQKIQYRLLLRLPEIRSNFLLANKPIICLIWIKRDEVCDSTNRIEGCD